MRTPSRAGARAASAALAGAVLLFSATDARPDPCPDAVDQYLPGDDGGFQAELLPDIVLGVPFGGGEFTGSGDVVSLGDGGSITLVFEDNEIVDGPGDDLRVFENPFRTGPTATFVEAGTVWASADGVNFVPFPYTVDGYVGLAGVTPVLSHPNNGIDPRTPAAGGDGFDLAAVGLSSARYIRIEDGGAAIDDPGNSFPIRGVGQSGLDLDAIVAVNSRDVCADCCDRNADGVVTIEDVIGLTREVAGVGGSEGACGLLPCRQEHCTDVDANTVVDLEDARACLRKVVGLPVTCAARAACDLS